MNKLRELQIKEKEMLEEFDNICRENNIEYWLDGGTLLGAIRHKGFIPWDDDIDVGMDKENYIKFKEVIENKSTNYRVIFPKKGKYMKLESKSIFIVTEDKEEFPLWIDIFPFDYYSNKEIILFIDKTFIQLGKDRENKRIITKIKNCYISLKRSFSKRVIRTNFFSSLFSRKKGFYIGRSFCSNYRIYPERTTEFFPLTELKFEGKYYKVPKNYNLFLKNLYGNYMEIPPIEKRESHFKLKKIIIK